MGLAQRVASRTEQFLEFADVASWAEAGVGGTGEGSRQGDARGTGRSMGIDLLYLKGSGGKRGDESQSQGPCEVKGRCPERGLMGPCSRAAGMGDQEGGRA